MMEMAFVSFNRVRLQYHISKGNRKALWLGSLIARPAYLFGTTLIGVNFFLQLGSELSRLLYVSLGLSANLALFSQIFFVVIFAELVPMFAARSHAEQTTMIGITPIYFLSKVLSPFIWVLNGVCRFIDWIFKTSSTHAHYLTREELQRAIEEGEDKQTGAHLKGLDTLVQNIFEIKNKSPKELMRPLSEVTMAPYNSTAKEVKNILSHAYVPFLPLYYKTPENIFGILYARDLLRLEDDSLVREIARSPWFITEKNSVFQILKQFRWNNQHLAIVLDDNGQATGTLTLDQLIEEIFHNTTPVQSFKDLKPKIAIDRSFPIDIKVQTLNEELHLDLPNCGEDSLEDLMDHYLGHSPEKGESVLVGRYRLILENVPLLADKTIRIISLAN
jgi:CBS domain containing-hemolysin-like protein